MENRHEGEFGNLKRRIVDEVPYGIYVWVLPDGEWAGDGDGNVMQVFCMKGDRLAMQAMKNAAKHYGFEGGELLFLSGHRPVSDEEYEEQMLRNRLGLIPDPLDYAALRDEERAKRKHNG